MSKNSILILIAVIVGCGIASIILYYVARFMRGSIKLFLQRTAFNPGERITGSFDLVVKKQVEGNKLTASLIGVQVTETNKNGKTQTQTREFYRDEHIIEEAKSYNAGHSAKYSFEISVPNSSVPDFMNTTLGQALNAASYLLGNSHSRIKWRVEARLDAKGVDLVKSSPVTINFPRTI
jgi:hypothetical protein